MQNFGLYLGLQSPETMMTEVESGVCDKSDSKSFLPICCKMHPSLFWQRWAFLLEEVKVALPKPERLLPNLIETDGGVEPEKIENCIHVKSFNSSNECKT